MTTSGVRRALLAVLGVALLAGCDSGTAMSGSTSAVPRPAPPTAECPAEGVRISAASAEAAMGIRVLTIEMANCGPGPYRVSGYPDVRLFDEEREPIDVAVLPGSASIASVAAFDAPPTPVTLRPGEKAWSGLLWRNLVTDSTVDATTAVRMEAASIEGMPWQRVPLVVPDEVDGTRTVTIDLGNTGKLGVRAWHKTPADAPNPPDPHRPA
ncbi:MAG TPA: DUF4232 domain-containing protein [Actinophytocola sp.]|nr:DUF4232 domain-containing protein [Actinophytocola sp.]